MPLLRALLLIVGMHGAFGEEGTAVTQALGIAGEPMACNGFRQLHLNARCLFRKFHGFLNSNEARAFAAARSAVFCELAQDVRREFLTLSPRYVGHGR